MLLAVFLLGSLIGIAHAGGNERGIKFLEENKGKPGVITLPSGLQYKVLNKGTGSHHPTADSPCECDYRGTLIDGTQFDAGLATFAPNQVIKGWTEAMQLMVEGDKWEMYIPSDLAYGDAGSGPKIRGGETLIFEMEIKLIKGGKKSALTCESATKEGCNEKEIGFIDKFAALPIDDIAKELARLGLMAKKPAAPDLVNWIERRMRILGQLKAVKAAEL